MKFLTIFLFLFSFLSYSKTTLQSGDVLLQPLKCWTCSLIEAEEESIYSHIGLVYVDPLKKIWVLESYMPGVRKVTLEEFLSKTEPGLDVLVLRSYESKSFPKNFSNDFINRFETEFEGLPYDRSFLFDDSKLYCSEFVLKLLNNFLKNPIPTKKMHFVKNREHWEKYFHGQIPDGLDGISPSDFMRNGLFKEVLHFVNPVK